MSDVLSLASVPVANVLASIPSPNISYLQLGPFRVHFYALCILAGMAVCLWLGAHRWKAAGGTPERVLTWRCGLFRRALLVPAPITC